VSVLFVSSTAKCSTALSDTVIQLSPEISGDNTLLIVGVTYGTYEGLVTSIEFGGTPLTADLTTAYGAGSASHLDSYYMISPPEGEVLIVLSCGGTVAVSAANFANVNQDNPFTASTSFLNTSSNLSFALTGGGTDEIAYDISAGHRYGSTTGSWTVQADGQVAGVTRDFIVSGTNVTGIGQSWAPGSDSVTFGWLRTHDYVIGEIAYSIKAVSLNQLYEQAVAGLLILSGILQSNALWKRAVAGLLVLSGALQSNTLWKRAVAGLVSFAGDVSDFRRYLDKSFGGLLDFSGVIDKKASLTRFMAGILDFSGAATAISKVFLSFAGTLNLSGAISNIQSFWKRVFTGTLILNGAIDLKRSLTRFFDGTLDLTGTASRQFRSFLEFAGTLVLSGTTALKTIWKRVLAGTLVLEGAVSDFKLALTRFLSGTLTFAGTAFRQFRSYLELAGTLVLSGVAWFNFSTARAFAGLIEFTGALDLFSLWKRALGGLLGLVKDIYSYFSLPFDDSLVTTQGQSPSVATGGLIFPDSIPSIGSGAVQLAEATSNFILNPRTAVDTHNWNPGPGNSITRTAYSNPWGDYMAECVRVTTVYNTWNNVSYTQDKDYVLSMMVKRPDGAPATIADITAMFIQNQHAGVGDITSVGDGWYRFTSGILTANATNTSNVGYYMAAGTLWITAVQLEQNSYPTPYCDGALGDGHSWADTVHDSISSRVKTSLMYELDMPASFTLAFWDTPMMLESETATYPRLGIWWGDTGNYLGLYCTPSGDKAYTVWVAQESVSYYYFSSNQWERNVPLHYAYTFDGVTLKTYVNSATIINSAPTQTTFSVTPNELYLGHAQNYGTHANFWMDDLVIHDYAMTSDEIADLYNKPGLPNLETTTLWKRVLTGLVDFAGAVSGGLKSFLEFAGTLVLSGTVGLQSLWKRVFTGTLVLTGAISDFKLTLTRFLAGTLVLAGKYGEDFRAYLEFAGTLVMTGAVDLFSLWKRAFAGTLVLAGTASTMFKSFLEFAGTLVLNGVAWFNYMTERAFAGTLIFTGAMSSMFKSFLEFAGTLILNGALDLLSLWKRAFAGTLVLTGGISKVFKSFLEFAGLLILGGALDLFSLWKRAFNGTIVLNGIVQINTLWRRAIAGVIEFSGALNLMFKSFLELAGTLVFSGVAQMNSLWKRVFTSTLVLTGAFSTMFKSFLEFSGVLDFAGALANYFRIQQQNVTGVLNLIGKYGEDFRAYLELAGTLVMSGVTQAQSLWKRVLTGTLVLVGSYSDTFRSYLELAGTLVLSGVSWMDTLWKRALTGVLIFGGALSRRLYLKRALAGLLTFFSYLRAGLPKFVRGTITLALKPITIIRMWLNPDADVDIV